MEETFFFKILLSIVVGALVGIEREYKSKSAGFRTMILISIGATVLTYCSKLLGSPSSPDRIASNIATGIGFIGAGVIFKTEGKVNGLTSAATIWAVAGMGMLIGMGLSGEAITVCGCILGTQFLMIHVEKMIAVYNQVRVYKIVCPYEHATLKEYEKCLEEHKLRVVSGKQTKTKDVITGTWEASGHAKDHEKFVKQLLKDPKVIDFEF